MTAIRCPSCLHMRNPFLLQLLQKKQRSGWITNPMDYMSAICRKGGRSTEASCRVVGKIWSMYPQIRELAEVPEDNVIKNKNNRPVSQTKRLFLTN